MITDPEFPALPENGMIFLDNCIFDPNDKGPRDNKKRTYSPKDLKQRIIRLNILEESLRDKENWCTMQEVLEEFIDGRRVLDYEIEISESRQVEKLLRKIKVKKEDIFELLNQDYRIANNNLVHELNDEIKRISPHVEEIFKTRAGKTNVKKTDTKLISLALAYAKIDDSYLFSQDKTLIKTFKDASNRLCLFDRTYLISYDFKKPLPTKEYTITVIKQREAEKRKKNL